MEKGAVVTGQPVQGTVVQGATINVSQTQGGPAVIQFTSGYYGPPHAPGMWSDGMFDCFSNCMPSCLCAVFCGPCFIT